MHSCLSCWKNMRVLLRIHTSFWLVTLASVLFDTVNSETKPAVQCRRNKWHILYKNTRGLLVQIWRSVFFEQDCYIHAAVPVAFHTLWTFKASEKISQAFCSMHKIQTDILIILPENTGHTTFLKYCMLLPNTSLIAIHDPNAPL